MPARDNRPALLAIAGSTHNCCARQAALQLCTSALASLASSLAFPWQAILTQAGGHVCRRTGWHQTDPTFAPSCCQAQVRAQLVNRLSPTYQTLIQLQIAVCDLGERVVLFNGPTSGAPILLG